ncbi:MAG: CHAD domain-containing protein [Gammaproteobacteria bacterium]|nr:MAG: CHAD domain-containing protein [Gammaproteobacteria bacterium]
MEAGERFEVRLRASLLTWLDMARREVRGILEGRDPEYLHRYRVNLRRCRGVLRAHKHALDPSGRKRADRALKVLVKPTNAARDLDVMLDDCGKWSKVMCDEPVIAEGMRRLKAQVARRKRSAYRALWDWLESEKAGKAFDEAIDALQSLGVIGRFAGQSYECVTEREFIKRYRMIMKRHARYTESGVTPEQWHALRLSIKSARYLAESLEKPGKAMRKSIKQLKHLQDELGRIQDWHVQRARVVHMLGQPRQPDDVKIALASIYGWLTARLAHHTRGEQ